MEDSKPAELTSWEEPAVARQTSDYYRKLLLAKPAVYARLTNPGGSLILTNTASRVDTETTEQYPSMIGSSIHLDLIDMEQEMKSLSKSERDALDTWVAGFNSREASYYLGINRTTIRKQRSRAIAKLSHAPTEQS